MNKFLYQSFNLLEEAYKKPNFVFDLPPDISKKAAMLYTWWSKRKNINDHLEDRIKLKELVDIYEYL